MSELFVVGTPIGNLGDITYRAVEVLRSVDFIAAEDTRVSAKLLSYLDIKKPMVSYHEHNHKYSGESIIRRILDGESCAVVTDAGMPCISDPGEDLVRLCIENNVPVTVVPGPTALISALAVSGLDTSRFAFEGFPSVAKRSRNELFAACAHETRTLIFYEAPHKLVETLGDLYKFFGDRRITLCRELTKIHEEIIRTTLSEAVNLYNDDDRKPRGEYVLIVEGLKEVPETVTKEDALEKVKELVRNGMRGADACREIAKTTPFSKAELYTMLLNEKGEEK
ncbi:MAG: 16S rRNA (cytidine(1402)-2'-O)-methyltransferase [Oscillospiraceae bacterium]|nr:16S rRNA (cytidine(1402)-2'-O)-methyltransferase [Oscillospiraceae bacterium]